MATQRLTTLKKMNTFDVIANIVELTHETKEVSVKGPAERFIAELARRLNIPAMEALFLAVFIDQCSERKIDIDNLAKHFDCRPVRILAQSESIDSLVKKGVIVKGKDSCGGLFYRVPPQSLEAIKRGELPVVESFENLTIQKWVETVDDYLEKRGNDEISDDDLKETLDELIDKNQHLHIARRLRAYSMDYSDLLLFLAMSMIYINDHDVEIRRHDISNYFSRSELRCHTNFLEAGDHPLMKERLVEHACIDGQIETTSWRLTDYSKYQLFAELNLKQTVNVQSSLAQYDTIQPKELYYNPNVSRQVNQLRSLLDCDKMNRVMKRLSEKGMRKGFACLFYGSPGTGKTETAMQLARLTKRNIMLVDIPSIRSCWVGETEKNIKEVFTRYRMAVEAAENGNQPILLFNEADAILCKRNEQSARSVDKMENAMQNIILQEMENLEGIMIATTNLTGSLDSAFERRFLFKIEFDKPLPEQRRHIWQEMLPDLSDADALMLAEKYDFSGGQIENIARKRVIDDVLEERDSLDIASIEQCCRNESLNKNEKRATIGFGQ